MTYQWQVQKRSQHLYFLFVQPDNACTQGQLREVYILESHRFSQNELITEADRGELRSKIKELDENMNT